MSIKGDVLTYFLEHEGERVSVKQLVTATGHTKEQVRYGVNNLRNDSGTNGRTFKENIEILVSGDVWCFHGDDTVADIPEEELSSAGGRMFEEVGYTVDGSILVKCEDGRFYKLIEV